MENPATGSSKLPYYPSKLQELLTADRCTRRSDLIETSSAASISGDSLGDDGTNSSSDAMSDKYRNPRKRLLLSSMNASEADESPDDQSEKGKKIMKWKADGPNGESDGANQGPASFKVAPIVLKKYYPKAVQSAECEEFLVSLSEDVVHNEGNGGIVPGPKANNLDGSAAGPVIKSKDDFEYMGAQIDKLLSMSSPKSSWKAPRRQRRFQCSECPKSYSTEDDLKSHVLSHSSEDAKPFECDQCDKKFKWVASLRVHKQKTHDQSRNTGTEDEGEGESSQGENSPSQEGSQPDIEDKSEVNDIKSLVSIATNSGSGLPQEEHIQSFESVVSKMVSSGLVSNNVTVTVEKSVPPPRRQCSTNVKDVTPPTRRSTPRKDSKSNSAKQKVIKDIKKKVQSSPVADETDECASPQTPTTGRSSLRRNIQRPKWLSDADLVTDYEFPRGTNTARGSATNSPSVATTPTTVVNGNQSQSRTVSTDSADEITLVGTPKSQKSDKNKSTPPTSRDRKRKEEIDQSEPKKKEVSKKAEKKELKHEKATKIEKSKSRRNNKQGESIESPPKQLSTKILTLSLEDVATTTNHGALEKIKKNYRKRSSNDSPSPTTIKSPPESRKSKRKRSSDLEEKGKQMNGIDSTDTGVTLNTSTKDIDDEPVKKESLANGDVETVNDNSVHVSNVEKSVPQEIELNTQVKDTIPNETTTDTTDAKKLEEETIDSNFEGMVINQESIDTKTIEASTNPCENVRKNSTDTAEASSNLNKSANEFDQLSAFETCKGGESTLIMGSNSSIECETQKKETETLSSAPVEGPFLNCGGGEAISFVDIPKYPELPQPVVNSCEVKVKDNEESKSDPKVVDHSAEAADVLLPPVVCGNDEEMPILRPETSSSAAGSRSDSFAERMQSIDEDVSSSSNSNHSTLPQAPVLSKQTTTFANGIVKVSQQDCSKAGFSGPVVDDDNQRGLPLMDEEETEGDNNKRLCRERSDSLSVRSCGSGSQSEKIKALDDTAPKDKRNISDHECLVDSDDSNDSLMSEFSELAAQLSEKTDGVKFKEECIRFLTNKVSASSMWAIRKELKRLKKDRNYFKFGKLSPLAAVLMQEAFCQPLE